MSSPELFELCSKLHASMAEAQLLSAIGCSESGEGLLHALARTETALAAYFAKTKLPRAALWLKVCRQLASRCDQLHEDGFVELGLPAPSDCSSVFAELARIGSSALADEATASTDQLLGLILLGAISSTGSPNVVALQSWWTLRRASASGRRAHSDWGQLVSDVPVTEDAIKAALRRVTAKGLRELLEEALHCASRPVHEPPLGKIDYAAQTSTHAGQVEQEQGANSESGPDDDEDPDAANLTPKARERKKRDDKAAKVNPTGWLIKSANYGRHVQRFGLVGDRDRQHPLTLQVVSGNLKKRFRDGPQQERDFVAVSHLSVRSALPGRLALHLPIGGTTYPRLDIARGELLWCYRQALETSRDADGYAPPLPPRSEEQVIRLVLDADYAQYLRLRFLDRPDSRTVGELFGVGPTEPEQDTWLRAYREFLRQQGDPAHPPFDARHARSLGDVYRHVCQNEILSAFLAADFQSCAMGLLHYLTFPAKYIAKCERDLFKFMALLNFEWVTGHEG